MPYHPIQLYPTGGIVMKTTAVRLEDELYAQLLVVVQLEGQTVTDAIRVAVEEYIEARKSALSKKAEEALADIEREAALRRKAIADLFGNGATSPESTAPADEPSTDEPSTTGRGRRTGSKDGGTSG